MGAQQRIAPLYKRLPHGPHRLERDEVVRNQRTRIHGAMIEAVATSGYAETSVKQVICLAGVSRRSFYEQFANKQECFLATFDLIARRELHAVRRAYLGLDGSFERRMRAGFERFARASAEDRNATVLVVLEAQTAGLPGAGRLRQATGACEHMLALSFAQAPGAVALPAPIVRAIAGGLHGAACGHLRRGGARVDVAREMLDWTLLFQTPAAERMGERLTASLSVRVRELASIYGHGLSGAEQVARDERARVLQAVLRLATREDLGALSALHIAEEANVSVDAFWDLFADRDECYLAALDAIGDELLAIAADPELVSEDWPRAVRRVLAELLRHLADHPLHARSIAQDGYFAGAEAVERIDELAHSIATLLTEGAPARAHGRLTVDAIAGAIWHTIRCQVAAGRVQLLPALCDHLAYVVLAPHLGADAAAELLAQERVPLAVGASVG
ncbi:MAG TPA: TetR/AcrR family transcriptional regulator [Solirubrobacteraceae bacterium]|nr:TetR/AcrR family transcriptional regulator [Solirubrobacteraceae bacterium]